MALLYVVLPLILCGAALWLISHYVGLPDDATTRNEEMERGR